MNHHEFPLKKLNIMKNFTLLLFIVALTATQIAFGQSGLTGINYQGVARNINGTVLSNQAVKVKISILGASANGPVQYQEEHALSTNQLGLFNLQIGKGTAISGTFAGVPWQNANQFAKVEMAIGGGAYTTLGNTQLMSVPFALYAAAGTPGPQGVQGPVGPIGPQGIQGIPGVLTGPAGGDLTGNYPNPVTAKLQGRAVAATAPTAGQALVWNAGTNTWEPKSAAAALDITLPFIKAQAEAASTLFKLTNSATTGINGAIEALTNSTDGNAVALKGTVTSVAPGGFSTAVRGINNGTGGLGIGVWGSQEGTGWGVYGVTPNGIGLYGNATTGGTGVYANSNTGTGLSATSSNGTPANFSISNGANNNPVIVATTSSLGDGIEVTLSNAGNIGNAITIAHSGVGRGVFATAKGGTALEGITSAMSAAGVIGRNTNGEAVVGISAGGGGIGAVVGRSDGLGYGVRGFNTKNGIGVLGQAGNSGGTGIAGKFENINTANNSEVLVVDNNGLGTGVSINMTNVNNGSRGLEVIQNGAGTAVFGTSAIGMGVWGITASVSAAGVIGDNTLGEAVVGRNQGGVGVGAVVGRNDGAGYGIRGFNTKNGIGVFGQAGNSGGTGRAARFENVNAANGSNTLEVSTNGGGNLAVFQKGGNVARIDNNGRGFFNGGTQNNGADIAEAFEVTGNIASYEAGDILIISTSKDRSVEKSNKPYSSLVAGVYATKPGVLLTEEHIDSELAGHVPMGVIGVIPTKVCLEGGAISRGDLLVTSSTAGVAMKADPDKVKIGQVLGKALESFDAEGISKIKVLVSIK
jgi:hypothetical protein